MYTYVIIDDEELIRKGTRKKLEVLEDRIICIGEASNGAQGIKLVESLSPDIVILDMQMPGMDGMELLPYLSEHYPDMPLIVISGYRDFEYIKQAISSNALEYLLKPFSRDAIKQVALKAIERIENHSSMYYQIKTSEQEKEQAQYDYDILIIKNRILGYHSDDTRLTSQKLSYISENHDLCLFAIEFFLPVTDVAINNILNEFGFKDLILYFQSPDNESLGLLLLFIPRQNHTRLSGAVEQVLTDLISQLCELKTSVCIGVSAVHSTVAELGDAYAEAVFALNRQLLCAEAPAYYLYDKEQTEILPLSWEREDELLFCIEAGMEDEVETLTAEMFSYYKTTPDCTLADVKYHCYLLSDTCRKILDDYIQSPGSVKSSTSMQNVVNHIFSLQELMDYYRQFFLNLTKMIKPNSVYAIDDVIQKIQIYIQRNYQKNLTEEFLSSLFCINRSYLSTLFKERTGEKFVDYLNYVRISRSAELLLSTDKKMYQIARAVGYDNVKYFFRIFKKQMKMTPEQYRTVNAETPRDQ